jgi:natural product precursor
MRKQAKKLNLNKETLRTLESLELKNLAGGVITQVNTCACPSHAVTNCATQCNCPTRLSC